MRIAFFTQEESLFLAPMFERVLDGLSAHERVVFLFADLRAPRLRKLLSLARTFGPAYTLATGGDYLLRRARSGLERAGVRLPGAPPSIAAVARRRGVPVHAEFRSANGEDTRAALAAFAPDLLVSIACPQILRAPVLSLARRYALNVHGGPLPRYRGMHSAFWQLYHGERHCATTVHVMTPAVDAGPILDQEPWEIVPGDTLHTVIARSKAAGARALLRVVASIERGEEAPRANDDAAATCFTEPNREQVREFRRRGRVLR